MEATTTPLVREGVTWERKTEGRGSASDTTRRERDGERSSRKVDGRTIVNERRDEKIYA